MTTGNNSPDQHHLARTLQAPPVPTADDIYYFREGTNNRLYRWLGAHPCSFSTQEGQPAERGCWFAVWAPTPVKWKSSATSTAGSMAPAR